MASLDSDLQQVIAACAERPPAVRTAIPGVVTDKIVEETVATITGTTGNGLCHFQRRLSKTG